MFPVDPVGSFVATFVSTLFIQTFCKKKSKVSIWKQKRSTHSIVSIEVFNFNPVTRSYLEIILGDLMFSFECYSTKRPLELVNHSLKAIANQWTNAIASDFSCDCHLSIVAIHVLIAAGFSNSWIEIPNQNSELKSSLSCKRLKSLPNYLAD